MRVAYECTITRQEDDKFLVQFPSFAEALTEGDSMEEALFNTEEVLTLVLDGRIADEMEIPLPADEELSTTVSYLIYPYSRIQAALKDITKQPSPDEPTV